MKLFKIVLSFLAAILLLNACQKEYSVENGGFQLPVGNWEFVDSNRAYAGNMDSARIVTSGATSELHLNGTSGDGTQQFQMVLYSSGSFDAGTYKASLFQASFNYSATAKTIYQASQLIGEFIVTITSSSNNIIIGTFSGTALDSANRLRNITNGKFKANLGSTNGGGSAQASSGVLGDSSGFCKPVILNGIYAQSVPLTSSNTAQVEVTVAVAGTYTISTNSVNGISFSKTGTFTSTGVQSVILDASGTPAVAGEQTFTLQYGNSQCSFKVNFEAPASGTLGGGGGNCTPFTFAGTYKQGISLNAGNTLQIEVNVITTGAYNIKSNTVNGVTFSTSGNFTTPGIQAVTLTGSGTPVNSGAQNFTINFGTSTCNFSLTFAVGATPSGDYFPLTLNSNWTYTASGGGASILKKVINYSPKFAGNTYSTIADYDEFSPSDATDSFYYRKTSGSYYEYMNYSGFFEFDQPVAAEYIFLKDNVAQGSTWQTSSINGTISGAAATVYIKMTLLSKSVSVTIGSNTFPDVIKVKYDYYMSMVGAPSIITNSMERWFAKNTGEIYNSSSAFGILIQENKIDQYDVK